VQFLQQNGIQLHQFGIEGSKVTTIHREVSIVHILKSSICAPRHRMAKRSLPLVIFLVLVGFGCSLLVAPYVPFRVSATQHLVQVSCYRNCGLWANTVPFSLGTVLMINHTRRLGPISSTLQIFVA
jgi:hypothetical protein